MRRFSRWMPPFREPPVHPLVMWLIIVPLALLTLPVMLLTKLFPEEDPLLQLASERSGEDIGTFARAFDRRSEPFDPWVVRATWDALQPYVSFRDGGVALRPTDLMAGDLGIDPDEIDMALLQEVAERSGHSLEGLEENPYFKRVIPFKDITVGDFVRVISWQPRASDSPSIRA